jgi:hypothetical protein
VCVCEEKRERECVCVSEAEENSGGQRRRSITPPQAIAKDSLRHTSPFRYVCTSKRKDEAQREGKRSANFQNCLFSLWSAPCDCALVPSKVTLERRILKDVHRVCGETREAERKRERERQGGKCPNGRNFRSSVPLSLFPSLPLSNQTSFLFTSIPHTLRLEIVFCTAEKG